MYFDAKLYDWLRTMTSYNPVFIILCEFAAAQVYK